MTKNVWIYAAGFVILFISAAWLGGAFSPFEIDSQKLAESVDSASPSETNQLSADETLDSKPSASLQQAARDGNVNQVDSKSPIASPRDWRDETEPYYFYDTATLEALARSGDAKAAELLSLYLYRDDPDAAEYRAIQAAALDGGPNSLVQFVDHHLSTFSQVGDALPLMITAKKLGNEYASSWIDMHIEEGRIVEEDLDKAAGRATEILLLINEIRRETLGAGPIMREKRG